MIVCLVVCVCAIMHTLSNDHFKSCPLSDPFDKLEAKDNDAGMLLSLDGPASRLQEMELMHLLNQTRDAPKESMLVHNHTLNLGIADAIKEEIRSASLPRIANTLPALDGNVSTEVDGAVTRLSPTHGERSHAPGRLASKASYGFLEYSDEQWGRMVAVHRAQSRRQVRRCSSGKCSYVRPTRGTVCGTMRCM